MVANGTEMLGGGERDIGVVAQNVDGAMRRPGHAGLANGARGSIEQLADVDARDVDAGGITRAGEGAGRLADPEFAAKIAEDIHARGAVTGSFRPGGWCDMPAGRPRVRLPCDRIVTAKTRTIGETWENARPQLQQANEWKHRVIANGACRHRRMSDITQEPRQPSRRAAGLS